MNEHIETAKNAIVDFWIDHGSEVLTYVGLIMVSYGCTKLGCIVGYNKGLADGTLNATQGLMDKIPNA